VTPSGTPSRRGSLGGAPVTAKLESLTQEVTDLKQERGTLRDLVTHLKAELKEKDRELETLKVDTHHSLAPWSSTRRAVRSFHVALYAVRALS
jgi:predicted  nucleic acid-binding Zn-ribbon protein